ncbi:metallophosphoesterase [Acinetobacter sp. MB5]|uniref:metallophosphoesterase n=1 Tax=Acinetobacter sp. MB5 TaxID=2069438 RepID=UPI000DCFD1C3|nr:metallophosphoesterase [Acinetobacter sp. MB5]
MAQHAQTIIQISDTHLMEDANATFVEMCPEQSFHGVMQHIVAEHPEIEAIIHTGDVAQDATPVTYTRYLDYMQGLGIPFYQTPGNHDDLQLFPYPQSTPITVIDLKPWVVILLTSAVTGKIDGHIDQDQLDQLDQLLQQLNDRFVLIGCHHHPLHMQSDWIDHHRLKNSPDLCSVLRKYSQVKAVIHGHVHQEFSQIQDNIQFLAVPSTCVQFKPLSQDFALGHTDAPGYRVLELYNDGHIESQVYRLDHLIPKINNEISGY